MSHDWLLVETLGNEPAVVAQGRQLKNLVPITAFLRCGPHLAAIRTAIAESVQSGQSLTSITPKSDRVIRTEPVRMSDGRIHGVHVWSGPADAEPPERRSPDPLKWDLTLVVATETPESLANSGKNPEVEVTHGRIRRCSAVLRSPPQREQAARLGGQGATGLESTWDVIARPGWASSRVMGWNRGPTDTTTWSRAP